MNDIKRVILKLSGEALSGDKKSGYDDELIMDIAGQVKQISVRPVCGFQCQSGI